MSSGVQAAGRVAGSDYKMLRPLGSGHFGDVFLAKTASGRNYAIKKVVNTEQNTAQQEIRILRMVDHEFIIKYYDHYMERGILCIVLEYADQGTFQKSVLSGTLKRTEWCVWRFIHQMSSAFSYLHSMTPKILHHDLKPENILGVNKFCKNEKDHQIVFKIADFGVAKMLNKDAQEAYYGADTPGEPNYMSPEVLRDFETYSAASDMWSLGCVIAFYMRKGKHVFYSIEDVVHYRADMADAMIFDEESTAVYSPDLVVLVCRLTLPNPGERPTADDVTAMATAGRREIGHH